MQQIFSKFGLFGAVLLGGLVVGAHPYLRGFSDRETRPDALAVVHFTPQQFARDAARPLRIAGAWRLTSAEPRLGGVSALAIDRGDLLALSDSGVVIRLPKPGVGRQSAAFHDLPDGPGPKRFKSGRDSEALALDRAGRGWWVAFENHQAAWLFDRDFKRVEQRIGLGRFGWPANTGAEGALSTGAGLWLFPEEGRELVRIAVDGAARRIALTNSADRVADVAIVPDGRIIVLARSFSPAGFSARLLMLDGNRLAPLASLRLGRLDNPEAIAAEALPGGGTRLWVMTDNDFRRRVPTLLIALDWAG